MKSKIGKLLIISAPRAGSTTLTNALGDFFEVETFHEPFNKHWGSHYKENYKFSSNCIVKVMSYEKEMMTSETSVEFLSRFSNNFEYTILLDRSNFKNQLESYSYMRQIRYDGDWQSHYVFDESVDILRDEYYLRLQKDNIKLISKNIKSEILYYENIYSNDEKTVIKEFNKINLDIDYNYLTKWLDSKNKLRLPKNSSII